MSVITRQIWITRRMRIQPIEIVQGSQIGIELQMMDYDVPTGASVKAYARGRCTADTYKADCTISGNTVSFTPPDGFFIPGQNRLQIEINGTIIPFSIEVSCESRISDAGDPATPEKVTPLVERAEAAASAAEKAASKAANEANAAVTPLVQQAQAAANDAKAALNEIQTNYPAIPEMNNEIGKLKEGLANTNTALTRQQKVNATQNSRLDNLEAAAQGYLYREAVDTTEAYEKTVPTDAMKWAMLDKIGGKTLVWNQIAKIEGSKEEHGITWTVTESGAVLANGTATADSFFYIYHWVNVPTIKAGQKLYVGSCDNPGGVGIYKTEFAARHLNNVADDFYIYNSGGKIVELTVDPSVVYYAFTVYSGVTVNNVKFYPILIDLTTMFGAGNEPSTPEEFRSMFPADYYPYSEPTLMNFSNSAVVSSSGQTLNTSAIVQKYFPDGMKSAGTVHDEIDWERMVAIQRVRNVDLGTLAWEDDSFTSEASICQIRVSGVDVVALNAVFGGRGLCSRYQYAGSKGFRDLMPGEIVFSNAAKRPFLRIRDDTYMGNASGLIASLNGVLFYYELAEPIETQITEAFDPSIEVESGGTLTLENDQGADFHVPVPNQETFLIKPPGGTT